jgi:outer membrane protein X
MKKLMMIAAMMLMSMGAFAQEAGKMAVGATVSDYLDSDSRIAIGAKFQYSLNENFRLDADFKLYPKKYYTTCWNPTINLNYLIPIFDKFYVYPLAGAGLFGYTWDYDGHTDSGSMFTVKFGAGAEYYITEQFKGLFEAYYQIAKKNDYKYSDPLISLCVAYCF